MEVRTSPPHFLAGERAMAGKSELHCGIDQVRNVTGLMNNTGATPCYHRNSRHSGPFTPDSFRSSGTFLDSLLGHENYNEAAQRVVNHAQVSPQGRSTVHSSWNCGQCVREPCGEWDQQTQRYCHAVTGAADAQVPHRHGVAGHTRHCCPDQSNLHSGGSHGADSAHGRMCSSAKSLSVSVELPRNAMGNGCMSHLPFMSRKVEMTTSSVDTTSLANIFHSTQASKKQVLMYGWFLVKPRSHELDSPTSPHVAIGGYKSPGMLETDYVETSPVVHRLERWKIRTSDGVDVGLMGMINIGRSVASGFSPALVQCFMIGFPSGWMHMMLSRQLEAPRGCNSGSPPCLVSPSSAPGHVDDTVHCGGETPQMPNTLPADDNPINSILSSSVYSAPNGFTRMGELCRLASTSNCHLKDGLSSDINSGPQCSPQLQESEQPKNMDTSSLGADIPEELPVEHIDSDVRKEQTEAEDVGTATKVSSEEGEKREKVMKPARQKKKYRKSTKYYKPSRKKSVLCGGDFSEESKEASGGEVSCDPVEDGPKASALGESHEVKNVPISTKCSSKKADTHSKTPRKLSPIRCTPSSPGQGTEEVEPPRKRSKPRKSIVPPPPPSPRVADKSKVPEAFGLKQSRHGRVIVPPLATWRNQSIQYDMDGGIIAIAEGFKDRKGEPGTGYKPPSDKDARNMQKKLCKAARGSRS